MQMIIVQSLIVLQIGLFAQQSNSYESAFEAYRRRNYDEAEKLFEKAYQEKINPEYSAYMIGFMNLYVKEVNYFKAIKYLTEVQKHIPKDINENYLDNHLGVAYLYRALDKKGKGNNYLDDLKNSEDWFFKAKEIDSNDITLNNIGRAKIESPYVQELIASAGYFRRAYIRNPKPGYLHNEATAYERVGHYYHSSAIARVPRDDKELELSYGWFMKALTCYQSNSSSEKSLDRAVVLKENILSLSEFSKFK